MLKGTGYHFPDGDPALLCSWYVSCLIVELKVTGNYVPDRDPALKNGGHWWLNVVNCVSSRKRKI